MWFNFNDSFESFCKKEKNSPGTLVEIMIGGKKKQFLIGDVGLFGSVMNGDCLILKDTFVIRYKIIWQRTK